jgi:hypothetical protein
MSETIFDYLLYLCAKRNRITTILPGLSEESFEEIKRNPKLILDRFGSKVELDFDNIPEQIFRSQHSTKYRCETSPQGYDFDILKSALQKYIRRGETDKAIYVATELYHFRALDGGKSCYTNFINRIKIITLEDIGIASPILCVIDKLLKELNQSKPTTIKSFSILYEIITRLSESLHYRYYSHLGNWIRNQTIEDLTLDYEQNTDPNMDRKISEFIIPKEDRCFDKWIIQMVLCLEHKNVAILYWIKEFFNTDKRLKIRIYNSNLPRYLAMYIISKYAQEDIFRVSLAWLKKLNVAESFLCAIHPAICTMIPINYGELVNITDRTKKYLKKNLSYLYKDKLVLDDYVIDIHTGAGKKSGKTTSNFAVEGSLIAYENGCLKRLLDNGMHHLYIKCKLHAPKTLESERDVFRLKSRAQLVCGYAKTDVYYATLIDNDKNVVVKGPYASFDVVNRIYQISSIMRWFPHINTMEVNIKLLNLDMFREKGGIGARSNLKKIGYGYFLVFNDIFDQTKYPTIVKESKSWPPTKVVDYVTLFSKINVWEFYFLNVIAEFLETFQRIIEIG